MEDCYIKKFVFFIQPKSEVEKFLEEIKPLVNFVSYDIWQLGNKDMLNIGLTKDQVQRSWTVWLYFEKYEQIEAMKNDPILMQMLEEQLWKTVDPQ